MTEYIIEFDEYLIPVYPRKIREEIVRCRDCSKWRFFDVDDGVRFGTCGEWERADSYCKPATREDGFCSWAVRREHE